MKIDYPIRILHILGSAQRGGTESVVFNYFRNIDRNKVQFDITIDNNSPCDIPKDIINMGCHVYRIPPYTRPLAYITAIKHLCIKNKYNIVHSHMNAMSVFPLFAAWLGGVSVRIAHSHSTAAIGRGEMRRNILKYILRPFSKVFATHYFACSDHAARWLFGNKTVDKGKVTILKNAVSAEKFVFSVEKREELREKLGIKEKLVIANVGRFSPPKNHIFLIDIFYALTKIRSDAHLLLVGGIGSAGKNIEKRMQEKIKRYGIDAKVSFIGTAEDISGFYQAADVFILPSLYEGLGIASIEAQCSGLPCILSDRVPREAMVNKNVVFLSLEEPPVKWAETIVKCGGERGDYSAAVSRAGYDIRDIVGMLERLYIAYPTDMDRKHTAGKEYEKEYKMDGDRT